MKTFFVLFGALLILTGCASTRQLSVPGIMQPVTSSNIIDYSDEIFWIPESHKEALVNAKENEDGSWDKAHVRKIRVEDGHWGTLEELINRLREEYGYVLEVKERPGVVVKKGSGKSSVVKKPQVKEDNKSQIKESETGKEAELNEAWDRAEKEAIKKGVLEQGKGQVNGVFNGEK